MSVVCGKCMGSALQVCGKVPEVLLGGVLEVVEGAESVLGTPETPYYVKNEGSAPTSKHPPWGSNPRLQG